MTKLNKKLASWKYFQRKLLPYISVKLKWVITSGKKHKLFQ